MSTDLHNLLLLYCINYTREDVGAECRHDMRPSFQLPNFSGVDSKLGLTMVRPSVHCAVARCRLSRRRLIRRSYIGKPVRQICGNFLSFLTSGDLKL